MSIEEFPLPEYSPSKSEWNRSKNHDVTCRGLKAMANHRRTSSPLPKSDQIAFQILPTQYGGYDYQLVIEWVRVRIPSKAWIYLLEKKLDFRLKKIPVSNGKQRTTYVLCWNHCLCNKV
ncbi:hypothetical protein TNCV_3747941 [Trichonephila clavipes]|nr:hypothetical protein TNCV_3747941 [Trichonephila clavipes]